MPGDTLFFFASLCLFLSSIEYAVPKPLPFMRLGLANLPVIFAVKSFRFREILLLIILKVLLAAFISGTVFSYVFLFSAAGSLASGLAVYLLYSCLNCCGGTRHISNVGLCLAGALANNAAQIAVARICIFGKQAYFIAPLLLATGLVTGLLLGLFANRFEESSVFLKEVRAGTPRTPLREDFCGDSGSRSDRNGCGDSSGCSGGCGDSSGDGTPVRDDSGSHSASSVRGGRTAGIILAAAALALMLVLPFVRQLPVKAALWLLLLAFVMLARRGRVRLLPSFILIASLSALSLLTPSGRVLHTLGSFRITQGALEAGLSKGLVLTGMLFASQTLFAALKGRGLGQAGTKSRLFGPVGRVFADFARLSARRLDIKGRGLMAALDGRLCELWSGTDCSEPAGCENPGRPSEAARRPSEAAPGEIQ